MRIVIDLQGAQAENRFSEIGRYSMSLAQAIVKNRGSHEIVVALNGLFEESIEPIRAAFEGLLSQENIRVWRAIEHMTCHKQLWRCEVSEKIREAFLASLQPDVLLISSFFEGATDQAVMTIGSFSNYFPTAVIFYGFCNRNQGFEQWYEKKLDHLHRADCLLAISESACRDALDGLNFPQEMVVNISEEIKAYPQLTPANQEDEIAIFVIEKLKCIHNKRTEASVQQSLLISRPKLAYLSPLPPERSGISDYSVELLPELYRYYTIDIITDISEIDNEWININCKIHTVEWFMQNANQYDRVVYHFGNSPYHKHMFKLLAEIPGVVVLHDFFLSGAVEYIATYCGEHHAWMQALYAHGYSALYDHCHAMGSLEAVGKYPCNFNVFRDAYGVIVHSKYSYGLARHWNAKSSKNIKVIPLLKRSAPLADKHSARHRLRLDSSDYIICSFGILGPTKLNHKLLEAWLASGLANDQHCKLIFVGESSGDYGAKLEEIIQASGLASRIRITGWVDNSDYIHYLSAADVAVQLRTDSRGETSSAILDCMNYSLPTIVNANGSLVELADEAVWKLPDEFSKKQLVEALETLWLDRNVALRFASKAKESIVKDHNPRVCVEQYVNEIETFYKIAATNTAALVHEVAKLIPEKINNEEMLTLSSAVAQSLPAASHGKKQLFIDVTCLAIKDLKTGIQRVVRTIVNEYLLNPPAGFRVEPVYALPHEKSYRYARHFTLNFLECPVELMADDCIEYCAGDVFLGLDLCHEAVFNYSSFYQELRNYGVKVQFIVYDLLCITMPEHFLGFMEQCHLKWLKVIAETDGAICISKAVADEVENWIKSYKPKRLRSFQVTWFHLGADIKNSIPSCGISEEEKKLLEKFQQHPACLMVGTVESRKGHQQTLAAFEQLWKQGIDINLVIVGKAGWKTEKLMRALRKHPRRNQNLFWFEGTSDEFLEKIYQSCVCLIAASEGEGFGLPLIEAAQHGLPIIARDIPVFREITQQHAFFFSGKSPINLAKTIVDWLALFSRGAHPGAEKISWITWRQSAQQLQACLLQKESLTKGEAN